MRRCDVVILGFRPDALHRCVEIVGHALGISHEDAAARAAMFPFVVCQDISLADAEVLEARLHEAGAVVECRLRRKEPAVTAPAAFNPAPALNPAPTAPSPTSAPLSGTFSAEVLPSAPPPSTSIGPDRLPTVAELLGSDGSSSGVKHRGFGFDAPSKGFDAPSKPPAPAVRQEPPAADIDMDRYISVAPRGSDPGSPWQRETSSRAVLPAASERPPVAKTMPTAPSAAANKTIEPAQTKAAGTGVTTAPKASESAGPRFDLWLVSAPPSLHDAERLVADLLGLDTATATKALFEAPSLLKASLSESELKPVLAVFRAAGLNVAGRPAVKHAPEKPRASVSAFGAAPSASKGPQAESPPTAQFRAPPPEAAPRREAPTHQAAKPVVPQVAAPTPASEQTQTHVQAAKGVSSEAKQATGLKVRVAYLNIEGVDVAVFDAHPRNGADKERAALLLELIARARQAGMRVTKAALAYSDGGSGIRYFGTPDLVRYLVQHGCGPWTHSLGLSRTA